MKTRFSEARKIRASKLRYIHFTDAEGALGMVKEKRIWQSSDAGHAVYAVAVGGSFVSGVQQTKMGRAKKRDVAVLFTTNEFPDVLYPEEVLWHKPSIKTTSIKIIPVWKARTMLDGSLVKDDTLTGIPAHPSTMDWEHGRVRGGKVLPVARVEGVMRALFTEGERHALRESGYEVGRVVRRGPTGEVLPDLPEPHGRDAVIILTAVKGHARAARALVSKAIKKVLRVRKWHTEPHYVHFTSGHEMGSYGGGKDGRYTLRVTDAEMTKLSNEISRAAKAAGWSGAPVDIYHD